MLAVGPVLSLALLAAAPQEPAAAPIAQAAPPPGWADRGTAAGGAGLGAAAGHVFGLTTSLALYAVAATGRVDPTLALLPTLLVPPVTSALGAAAGAAPFAGPAGALAAAGAALLAGGAATGAAGVGFLVVLSTGGPDGPPAGAIDAAVATLLVAPALVAALAAGGAAALLAEPAEEDGVEWR